jgi:hypothetical protein
MATPHPPTPTPAQRELPAITIDGHALFEFSLKMNRALKRFENRFGAQERNPVPFFRQTWQQASRKPR